MASCSGLNLACVTAAAHSARLAFLCSFLNASVDFVLYCPVNSTHPCHTNQCTWTYHHKQNAYTSNAPLHCCHHIPSMPTLLSHAHHYHTHTHRHSGLHHRSPHKSQSQSTTWNVCLSVLMLCMWNNCIWSVCMWNDHNKCKYIVCGSWWQTAPPAQIVDGQDQHGHRLERDEVTKGSLRSLTLCLYATYVHLVF